jgi:hypothetical protein
MIGPGGSGSTQCAIARASGLPDGMTAPVAKGLSNHERIKRISSSIRAIFCAILSVDWNDMGTQTSVTWL